MFFWLFGFCRRTEWSSWWATPVTAACCRRTTRTWRCSATAARRRWRRRSATTPRCSRPSTRAPWRPSTPSSPSTASRMSNSSRPCRRPKRATPRFASRLLTFHSAALARQSSGNVDCLCPMAKSIRSKGRRLLWTPPLSNLPFFRNYRLVLDPGFPLSTSSPRNDSNDIRRPFFIYTTCRCPQ